MATLTALALLVTVVSGGDEQTDHQPAQDLVEEVTPYGIWDRLAACEASGDWHSASNPRYKGGLQMDATFWRNYGGLAYASRADLASREEQIAVAKRGQAVQGWGAWPVCSRQLRLH